MKKISLSTLIIFPVWIFSQNWSPIQSSEKMNYQHSDSTYISHTIWVDDYNLSGPDTTFFLNRIVKDHPTDIDKALRNQPQFLFAAMSKLNNGIYHFADPGYYILKPWASMGDSWLFDPDNNLQATVSALLQEEIMGVIDSIKIISLSNGSEIKLSKGFGIIQFPDFDNGGYYGLVGIQDTEYGESVPGFWEIYDFEVGDVFQFNENSWFISTNIQVTRKITITDKSIVGNSISYNVDGIYSAFGIEWGGSSGWEAYAYTDVIDFTDSTGHLTNKFPNELAIIPNTESMIGLGKAFVKTEIFVNESLNTISKQFGLKFYTENPGTIYYDIDEESDTLYKYNDVSIIDDPCGYKGLIYSNYLGYTYHAEGCFEYEVTKFLEGYIKNSDTTGNITSDSTLLTVSIKDNFSITETIKVYPNPASEILNISLHNEEKAFFELRNIQGQTVKLKEVAKMGAKINVADLVPGIYFYLILQENSELLTGKVLIY